MCSPPCYWIYALEKLSGLAGFTPELKKSQNQAKYWEPRGLTWAGTTVLLLSLSNLTQLKALSEAPLFAIAELGSEKHAIWFR